MKRFFGTILPLFLIIAAPLLAQDNEAIARRTEEYLLEVKKQWQIPGMAMAIVKDGEVVYSNGFGVKEMGGDRKVDSKTVFQIGSVSKSFTAAVLASLVDEGLVKWDDTVKNILPDFGMYDKWVEANLQVKDVMTHRSGLQGQLGTYIPNMGYSRDDIYQMLPLLKPKYSLRGSYEYNNVTFIIAAKIIEKLTGKSWDDNVRERVFAPLGMTSSYVTGEEFAGLSNVAVPHRFSFSNDSVSVAPLYGAEQALHWLTVIGPAGSISSNVEDMAKYLIFHLKKGAVGEEQVISREQVSYLHRGHTITSQDSSRITLYGHCWFIEQNNRYRVVFHTGTTWGFTALAGFVPEQDLGFVILVNSEAPAFPRYAIMRRLIDLYMGFPDKDYNTQYYGEWLASAQKRAADAKEKEAETEKLPAPELKRLTGKYYKDALFGGAEVTLEKGELFIKAGPKNWKSPLKHRNGNEFGFRMDGNEFKVTFIFDADNKKCTGIDINFGYTENFGVWDKIK